MTTLIIPIEEVERYRTNGLALVDVRIPPIWGRGLGDYVAQIKGVPVLEEHSRPVHAWVKRTSEPRKLRVCIASIRRSAPNHAITFDPLKQVETLDLVVRQIPRNFWYNTFELTPEYKPPRY